MRIVINNKQEIMKPTPIDRCRGMLYIFGDVFCMGPQKAIEYLVSQGSSYKSASAYVAALREEGGRN